MKRSEDRRRGAALFSCAVFRRACFRSALFAAGLVLVCTAKAKAADEPLPPVPVEELSGNEARPSFDVGLLAAVCGVSGDKFWQRTQFCLGGVADLLFLRTRDRSPAVGGYVQAGTAGFNDSRFSLGVSALLPVGQWMTLTARLGPMLKAGGGGAQVGGEGYLELGQRSYSEHTGYSLSHALLAGLQVHAAGSGLPSGTALWLGVRVDAYWLTLPRMLWN